MAGPGAKDRCGVLRWTRCAGGVEWGELAGLPEFEEVAETGEQAGEGGEDECVQRGHDPGLGDVVAGLGFDFRQEVGDMPVRGRGCVH